MQLSLDSLPLVRADPAQLERVFANLLDNACRFSTPGRPVRVTGSVAGERVQVRVTNEGPTIPRADRLRIFEPFAGASGQARGVGLGLAICRGFVEANGGRIELQSSNDETSFTVSFPRAPQRVPAWRGPDSPRSDPGRTLVAEMDPEQPLVKPSRGLAAGVLVAALAVALTTLIVYPLKEIAPAVSLGVVYLLAVLLVATIWGAWLGIATAVASALAFNFFHIEPTGRFTIADGEHWVALAVFFVAALVASELAQRARQQAQQADERRREADLSAEMARLLLRAEDLEDALADGAHRIATTLGLPSAAVELRAVDGDFRRLAFPLREGSRQLGTLLVPVDLPEPTLARLQERVVPSLEALLAAAIERDELLSNRVEAAALRRTDVLKTALLRAVSHDLRSPLTAIMNAAGPLQSDTITRRGAQRAGRGDHPGGAAALAPDRQPARPVPARGRRGRRRSATGATCAR